MAELPTNEEIERAVLDLFKKFGTRPGESLSITKFFQIQDTSSSIRNSDVARVLTIMAEKGLVILESENGPIVLTETGFKAI